jgi:hypothetical protein
MTANGNSPTLADAKNLLEHDDLHPVFLHIEAGKKGPEWSGWSKITYAETLDPHYQSLLRSRSNTGILLGAPSDDLCALDFDTDAALEAFIELNPAFETTLRTRGGRGAQLWAYLKGDRPRKIHKLKVDKHSPLAAGLKEGADNEGRVSIGEFRAEGGQSVICGIHTSGFNYTWLVSNPPPTIAFDQIRWPNDITIPWEEPRRESSHGSSDSSDLLQRAIENVTVTFLWTHFNYPQRRQNPTHSPFRTDKHPSFSIYDEGRRFKDHAYEAHRGDSFNSYQLAMGQDARTAFEGFIELAGLGAELRKNKTKGNQDQAGKSSAANPHANGQQPPLQTERKRKKPELILPSGAVTYSETARAMFPTLAKTFRYFVRGRVLVELAYQKMMRDKQPHDIFQLLEPDALRSRIEEEFSVKVWREERGSYILKHGRSTHDAATVLLKTDAAFQFLPYIAKLSARPVLARERGKLRILYKGFHETNGGIYVSQGSSPLPVPSLDDAKKLLLGALVDYDFVSRSDKSRAIAAFISPALRVGDLLGDEVDFPIDIGEADESQSGKTFRQKLVCAIYGETPYVIANREGGVGSLDESISSALIAGIPFILFENFRGQMHSQLVETCLRGTGTAPARVPHKGELQVPTGHINWQLSSNGLDATRDFANRSIITRISKRAPGHPFAEYGEGNILAHIKANQPAYQAAIFRIIMEWDAAGRQRTKESRHDFTEWAQTLDWIVQEIFGLDPLIDGHVEEILRVSNPALSWLRSVAIAVEKEKRLEEGLLATEIVDICQGRGVELPGVKVFIDPDQMSMCAGRLLNRIFHDTEKVSIDRYKIRRDTRDEYNHARRKTYTKHYYWFEKRT